MEVTGRPAQGRAGEGECDIRRYGGGVWNSYPDLVQKVRQAFAEPGQKTPPAAGPCADPWVSRAVLDVAGRPAQGRGGEGECDIRRYGGGVWNSYPDLVQKVRQAFAEPGQKTPPAAGPCSDPWVSRAVLEVVGRPARGQGGEGECDIRRYGGGSWKNYPDLVEKVRQAFASAPPAGKYEFLSPRADQVFNPGDTVAVSWRYEGPMGERAVALSLRSGETTIAGSAQQVALKRGSLNWTLPGQLPPGGYRLAAAVAGLGEPVLSPPFQVVARTVPPMPVAPPPVVQPPELGGPLPPDQELPPFRFSLPPPAFQDASAELKQFSQLARGLADAARQAELPDVENAAGFFAAAASLADLLADPNRLLAMAEVEDPSAGRVVEAALAQVLGDPARLAAVRAFNQAALNSAWQLEPGSVHPVASWLDRSYAEGYIGSDFSGLVRLTDYRQRIDWRRYDRVQTLFLLIELGGLMKQAQVALSFTGKLAEAIEEAVDSQPGLSELPVPQFQAALKGIAVTSVLVELGGLVLEGAGAFIPARIREFYVLVDNTNRRAGSDPITIQKGRRIRLDVYMTYANHDAELETPWTLIKTVAEKLLRTKRVQARLAALERTLSARVGKVDLRNDTLSRIVREGYPKLVARLDAHFRSHAGVYAVVGSKVMEYLKAKSPKWKITGRKGSTTSINSDKVITMRSNSPALLKVGQTSERDFYLEGLADSKGQQAGFHVALKGDLIGRMVRTPGDASPNLLGVVLVEGPADKGPAITYCTCRGGLAGIRDREDGKCYALTGGQCVE